MKNQNIIIFLFLNLAVIVFNPLNAQRRSGGNDIVENTRTWNYEIESAFDNQESAGGTVTLKVWTYASSVNDALKLAPLNAVHGVIFRGVPAKGRFIAKPPLTNDPNLEETQQDFFNNFFSDGGKYMKFVNLVNNGNLGPNDIIALGKKEFKVAVTVQVNFSSLRSDLEAAGIIRSLGFGGSGF